MDRSLAAAYGAGRRALARGTTRRFLLLLCVLVAACLAMFSTMAVASRPQTFEQCVLAAATADLDGLLTQPIEDHEPFRECRSRVTSAVGREAALATGAVAVTGLLCYWWLPAWRTRRRRLLPAVRFNRPSPGYGPETVPLTEQLARLSERAGLSRRPEFVVDPQAMTAGAVAFGRAGRYTVCLHAGLIPRRFTDPAGFEAVVLHELAHVRNRDVDLTYLTVILWRVLLAATLLPYLALLGWLWLSGGDTMTWANHPPSAGKVGFALLVAGQVYMARAEVLRYRELCADLDAVRHGADPAGWDNPQLVGPRSGAAHRRRSIATVVRWFTGLWHGHPSWQRRHQLLTGAEPIWPGATGQQALLIAVAVTVLLYPWWGNLAWPAWLFATFSYTVGPLIAIVLFTDLPEKRPPSPFRLRSGLGPLDGAVAAPARSERRMVWSLAAAAALIGTLLVVDPLNGYRGDGITLGAGLTAPQEYGPRPATFPRSFPAVGQTSAEVAAWLTAGGRGASSRLHRVVTTPPAELASREARAAHCAAATAAVAEARATAAPPVAGRSWQVLVLFTRLGSEAGCTAGSGGRYYAIARDAYQQFALSVFRYAPGSLPLQ